MIEEMRRGREIATVVMSDFRLSHSFFKTHAFCFFEGQDGKYYNPRIKVHFNNNFIALKAGNKKEVLRIMQMIQSDSAYKDVCKMFFIDRDYDESLANTNDDLFETPCYSIENFYAQKAVFISILQTEFGLNEIDSDYKKCLEDYDSRFKEYLDIIIKFNALIKYQKKYKQEKGVSFNDIKIGDLAEVSILEVKQSTKYDSKISSIKEKLNVDLTILEQIENELKSAESPCLILRGKNQLDFLISILQSLKSLNDNYFSKKLQHVHLNITKNCLSELSQYAITPPELEVFLKRHKDILS